MLSQIVEQSFVIGEQRISLKQLVKFHLDSRNWLIVCFKSIQMKVSRKNCLLFKLDKAFTDFKLQRGTRIGKKYEEALRPGNVHMQMF